MSSSASLSLVSCSFFLLEESHTLTIKAVGHGDDVDFKCPRKHLESFKPGGECCGLLYHTEASLQLLYKDQSLVDREVVGYLEVGGPKHSAPAQHGSRSRRSNRQPAVLRVSSPSLGVGRVCACSRARSTRPPPASCPGGLQRRVLLRALSGEPPLLCC